MGIFSNIIFFTFARNYIIDNNFRLNNTKFCEFEDYITKLVKEDLIEKMNLKGDNANMFNEFIDVKSFYLNKIEIAKISFIKDSFLYYLDFQLNILLAIDFTVPSIIYLIITQSIKSSIHWITISIIIIVLMILILLINLIFIKSARLNYKHHKRKYLSLVVGSFYFTNQEINNKK
ncbi:MAG: hypothetical protein A2W90_19205 [Bacteroidetes bacterium GWF2_42_66]|nr:MAG: hypothetical protein A2W92_06020 [Bacteroidetes bacterium GWA2_42_15]OFX98704.1 MAG: hypothetical protein A2W89_10485 [Bacteroidetes bacterium GWE2_42_39]OFY43097.1 MAG: hypothetical protein A2W90_19205 [Bacteroidetes bacterium GWF2_42_66]HBL77056.1 hypothetical protein [Prolixibacteraceae bacterium]HCU59890.1 hypothetical protein [Prolixibacteraceae bacterium]